MASRCDLTGKGAQTGNNVSFSLRRTKRRFKPNLQKKTFIVDGQKVTMTLSTQAIRTLKKKGILQNSPHPLRTSQKPPVQSGGFHFGQFLFDRHRLAARDFDNCELRRYTCITLDLPLWTCFDHTNT